MTENISKTESSEDVEVPMENSNLNKEQECLTMKQPKSKAQVNIKEPVAKMNSATLTNGVDSENKSKEKLPSPLKYRLLQSLQTNQDEIVNSDNNGNTNMDVNHSMELKEDKVSEEMKNDSFTLNLSQSSVDDGFSTQESGTDCSPQKKKKIRSNILKQLETSLTAKITDPTTLEEIDGNDSFNKSRYGRARKQKTIADFYRTDSLDKNFQIFKKSPSKTPPGVKTPKKSISPKKSNNLEMDVASKSPENLIVTPWNQDANKKAIKVYVRKDMIQKKRDDTEETGSLLRNMFSPPKIPPPIAVTPAKPIEEKKIVNVVKKLSMIKDMTVSPVKEESDSVAVIASKDIKLEVDVSDEKALQIAEEEQSCSWRLGELAWARVGAHPFWPCLITRDPEMSLYVRKKTLGRSPHPVDFLHVTFFADSGRRSWLQSNCLMIFTGLDDYNKMRADITPEIKKKDPKYCHAFNVTQSKMTKWLSAVSEAEMLLRRPPDLREQFFITMFLSQSIATPKPVKKEKKIKIKTENPDTSVSLSETLFDSLFSAENTETVKSPETKTKDAGKNVDVVELVSACLDTIAAKSGNEKIKAQSHMDRWLLKAKKPSLTDSTNVNSVVDLNTEKNVSPDNKTKNKRLSLTKKLSPTKMASVKDKETQDVEIDVSKKKKTSPVKMFESVKNKETKNKIESVKDVSTPLKKRKIVETVTETKVSESTLCTMTPVYITVVSTLGDVAQPCSNVEPKSSVVDNDPDYDTMIPANLLIPCADCVKNKESDIVVERPRRKYTRKSVDKSKAKPEEKISPKKTSEIVTTCIDSTKELASSEKLSKTSVSVDEKITNESISNDEPMDTLVKSEKPKSNEFGDNRSTKSTLNIEKIEEQKMDISDSKDTDSVDKSNEDVEMSCKIDEMQVVIQVSEATDTSTAVSVESDNEKLKNAKSEKDVNFKDGSGNDLTVSGRSLRSKVTENSFVVENIVESSGNESDQESDASDGKSKKDDTKSKQYQDPEFQEYFKWKHEALSELYPEWTEEVLLSYMYKSWLHLQNRPEDKEMYEGEGFTAKVSEDDKVVVKPKRKSGVRCKTVKPDVTEEEAVPREKSLRKKSIKEYLVDKDSDSESDDVSFVREVKSVKSDQKSSSENLNEDSSTVKSSAKKLTKQAVAKVAVENVSEALDADGDEEPELEWHMLALTKPKPNIFKGLLKEKVCELCETPSNLIKCRGLCGGMFHAECVKKQADPSLAESSTDKKLKGRKRRSKKMCNALLKKKMNLNDSKITSELDTTDDGQSSSLDVTNDSTQKNPVVQLRLSGEVEILPGKDPSPTQGGGKETASTSNILSNAAEFESRLTEKMKEMLANNPVDDLESSTSSGDSDYVYKNPTNTKNKKKTDCDVDAETFKCNDCQKYDTPLCFICKSLNSPKTQLTQRQKCNVNHCNKYYHIDCLSLWPQTKYNSGAPSKNSKKISPTHETMSCPRHVCHTCVSDDPQGSRTRFSGDKLARCVKCPATYHCFTQCTPAGSKVITASQIVCPKHCDVKPTRMTYHVNTSWCFICAKGGSLICCETCPTSFHAECLQISPPEGGYICEDCQTGRLPLYGELVWVKLGQYRWWPALVLHPAEVPPNVAALPHLPGQFAVRFFGGLDHYWISGGRVFPYQEGDTGHASTKKSAVDFSFLTAVKQAQQAYTIIQSTKESNPEEGSLESSLLPPQYVKLKVNRAVGGVCLAGNRGSASGGEGAASRCDCKPNSDHPCGPDTDCLNRMLLTECTPSVCAAGERCGNQAFEKRLYPPLTPCRTSFRGWGLKTLADIKKGHFIIEYVGEVVDEAEFKRRMLRRQEVRDENYYFLTLDKDRMIDAGPKGNVARFMNHSCEPNCETQKWTVNGDTRVGLFALHDIPADSELTFNYNLTCAGDERKKCLCGAKRCGGFIGAKPKQDELPPKKVKIIKKRKYKKKPVVSLQPKPSTSNEKKKKDDVVEAPVNPNASWIDKDLEVINKAIADVEKRDKSAKPEKQADSYKDNITKDCTKMEMKLKISRYNANLDEKINDEIEQTFEEKKSNIVKNEINGDIKSELDGAKTLKRKRLSLTSPVKSDASGKTVKAANKSKRPRSDSVHFSESMVEAKCQETDVKVKSLPIGDVDDDLTQKKVKGRNKKMVEMEI